MTFPVRRAAGMLLLLTLASCEAPLIVRQFGRPLEPVETLNAMQTQTGIASVYRDRRTASGERFRATALTAAHRTWPMGTQVRVTHLGTGRTVIVRINDRGPFTRGRVIDLTPAAASAIGLTPRQGITKVKLERLN